MATRRPNPKGIHSFLESIAAQGGLAFSNTYEVTFGQFGDKLKDELSNSGFISRNPGGALYNMELLCEEASLPGMMANTGQTTGKFLGEGQVNYAHTKSYQDLTLGWTCDANLSALKFLNAWMKAVFVESGAGAGQAGRYTTTRLNYPDEYMCRTMTILKAERNASGTVSRGGGIYTFNEVWPYAIQSTPVSYGSSQLLKVTASFYYRNWRFEARDGASSQGN
jgi:hypothetical protein